MLQFFFKVLSNIQKDCLIWQEVFNNPYYSPEIDLSDIKLPSEYYLLGDNNILEHFEFDTEELQIEIMINYLAKHYSTTSNYIVKHYSIIDFYKISGIEKFNSYLEREAQKRYAKMMKDKK